MKDQMNANYKVFDILTSFAWSATVADDDLGATSTTENNNELSCVIFKESTSLFRVKKKEKNKKQITGSLSLVLKCQ